MPCRFFHIISSFPPHCLHIHLIVCNEGGETRVTKSLMREICLVLLLAGWAAAMTWNVEGPGSRKGSPGNVTSFHSAGDVCRHRHENDPVKFADENNQTVRGVCRDFDGQMIAIRDDRLQKVTQEHLPPVSLNGGNRR